ncbi:chitinase domain-containing protein 1 [Marchantia polymorpha subsp. ruderalis]|uniref:Chitinase domain-containing protein 1 n=4 Tax=Marchantia polymorpha TaxID=3197 RepID=A0A176WBK3_MARPO|nr:hypothetical protein AXG93_4201s1150 [Marchantia polymorpha subsp. ruderalis]PTQ32171.1 hypothetical protein MARPO_0102s0038 [Marchantia polymorpha]BBN17918.1 hypothetical protein Mp_7g18020 [Marchantia polymorpha subsp. ruderalis]|eukprot:PTQ32171.1 hypothetical protein MARPO_0102s0038 [Marchantia polymorpha]
MPSQGAGQRRRVAAKPPRPPVRNARGGRNYEQQSPESVKNKLSVSVLLSVTAVCVMLAMLWGVWLLTRRPDALVAPPSVNQLFNVTATASVYDRGLVKAADLSYEAVLKDHPRYWTNTSHRHFKGSVLAYVTPWNGKGYDMAKLFRSKFTHVSPVWYQLKRDNSGLHLHGRHDVDQKWISDVRQGGSPKIVPRVVLEGYPTDMLTKEEEREEAIDAITSEVTKMQFDGIVLEAWSLWRGYRLLQDSNLRQKALEFIKLLGMELHTTKSPKRKSGDLFQLILVIPPPTGTPQDPNSFTTSDMIYLRDSVDGFSLMTYDYSNAYAPGPNAPLAWMRQCLAVLLPKGKGKEGERADARKDLQSYDIASRVPEMASKTLMGINFYGNDYSMPQGGGAIVGHEYISLLAQHKPILTWEEASSEHYFTYSKEESMIKNKKTDHKVYYPSLQSLSTRLEEAKRWGVGISIWEIGQGLEYFFDIL